MKQKLACEECIYFERHYIKINGIFKITGCGHCVNNLVKPRKGESARTLSGASFL